MLEINFLVLQMSSFIKNTGRRFHYKVQWSEVNYFISALKIDFLRRTLIVCSRLANMIFSPRWLNLTKSISPREIQIFSPRLLLNFNFCLLFQL